MRITSKSLSGLKLAVAALVVAGFALAVSAAPNFSSGSVNASFSFDNPFEGTIEWAKGPDVDATTILNYDVIGGTDGSRDDFSAIGKNSNFIGNVGVLAIKTNAGHWDVKMTSRFGGRLFTEGKDTTIKVPSGCGFSVACRDTVIKGKGKVLTYSFPTTGFATPMSGDAAFESVVLSSEASIYNSTSASDEVLLDVAIGAAMQAVSGAFFSVGCVAANCSGAPLPLRVGKAKVALSDVEGSEVSFAEVVSEGFGSALGNYTVPTTPVLGNNPNLVKIDDYLGLDLRQDITDGTTKITAAQIKDKGFKGKNNAGQYIFVNVGIHPDNTSYISSNGEDLYKETLTFTLYNGF